MIQQPEGLDKSKVLVRVGSHRAGHKLERFLGYHPQYWYNLWVSYQCAEVPASKIGEVAEITGITKARIKEPAKWHPCWSTGIARQPA